MAGAILVIQKATYQSRTFATERIGPILGSINSHGYSWIRAGDRPSQEKIVTHRNYKEYELIWKRE